MNLVAKVEQVRRTHEALRAEPPAARNLDAKAPLYRSLKAALDDLWRASDGAAGVDKSLRRAIERLVIDAEYFAGLSDAEGFRDPAEVWAEYRRLEQAFAADRA